MNKQAVLDFWFDEANQPYWFQKSEAFDAEIRRCFFDVWQQAVAGELSSWRSDMSGRLAEIIVLDQFSRNLFRNHAAAFAQDTAALILAQEALAQADFAEQPPMYRHFILMPFMHSESKVIHNQAVALFEQYTSPATVDFELKHKAIIDRFGRYPHRNEILGRTSSEEEILFLQQPDSSF